MLKSKPVGAAITLLISRCGGDEEQRKRQMEVIDEQQMEKNYFNPDEMLEKELKCRIGDKFELLRLNIPLNATPGAGLGISIKAQRLGSNDRGLYVRSVRLENLQLQNGFRFYTVQQLTKMRGFA